MALAVTVGALAAPATAAATPVCTDGYMGGPPAELCGGRIFPEAELARAYVQFTADPFTGFNEYAHGLQHLAQKYPRWVSVTTLAKETGDPRAVSVGADGIRSTDPADTGDGRDIWIVKVTDHQASDEGKQRLVHSLSVHGNERGGLEGGLRTAEDLAMAAEQGGKIADGVDNYESTTGRKPEFHEYEVSELLAKQVLYLVDFNPDGWAVGDLWASPLTAPYSRGNELGTDLNRQMPTVGRINPSRNPLQESEMRWGLEWMRTVAGEGPGGKLAYGSDIHGELTSQAYVDVMYPAGQFDSVDHRRLMAIAERTKSVIDDTLYEGIIEQIEEGTSGNEGQAAQNVVPTKPAHWATVWDTLGYTDTGFIGDYLATDLGVTGMDYEIAYNHTVPDKVWNVYLQENHINATRAIIKTSMAYAMTQEQEFSDENVKVGTGGGRAGYVINPDTVTDSDENGPGTLPGPNKDGVGADGNPVEQRPYDASNMRWFEDTKRLMDEPFVGIAAKDVTNERWVKSFDTLVLADTALPADAKGRAVEEGEYYGALKRWVEAGGNLVLTDRALHALPKLGLLGAEAVKDIKVYQPYTNLTDYEHPLAEGLRSNARQLVEAPALGYGIGNSASPMTVVTTADWTGAGGKVIGTTGNGSGSSDDGTQTSVGELALGKGKVRIVGGALPTPTEENDHRFGLRDYAMTYTALFLMENAIEHDAPGLGELRPPGPAVAREARWRCKPRRGLTVRLPKGTKRVTVKGKRVKIRRSKGRRVVRLDLRKVRGKRVTVKIQRKVRGKRVTTVKRYRIC